ncbi:tetratricopeptide repeat protein [Sulfuriroseicoccus oceanibius]|uniref:Tetratricopeptide repeat protein n=1 Tax=Sulfuriroseicoccus oceanibius TaxID=2707525 RepID=A0A6B3L962_9BACT|nr:tetratricopeptide repeat protein [Sulfuriroseicoccus oceanibius]QQL46041.1 tetratricopeptide repeat protein [Sulfuriroseicoccus oceanibius]
MSTGDRSRILENRAQSLFEEGKFADAMTAAAAATESARRVAVQDDSEYPGLIEALLINAEILRHVGEFDESANAYKEAAYLIDQHGGSDVDRARVAMGRAICTDAAGNMRAASKLYEQAIEELESLTPPDLEEAANLRNNLAMLYREEGLFDRAEEHYVSAINICERIYGKEDLTVAALYNNLAALYLTAAHYPEALEIAKQALAIREKLLAQNSAEIAQSYSNLGSILYGQGELDEAIEHFQRAVEILEEGNETDPEEYEVVISNYIDLLKESGDTATADEVTKRAREHYRAINTAQ